MAGSNDQEKPNGAEQSATAGEKHQTDHDSPGAKRTKTERQTTLDETLENGSEQESGAVAESDEGDDAESKKNGDDSKGDGSKDTGNQDENSVKKETVDSDKNEQQHPSGPKKGSDAVQPSAEEGVPSSVLEKGIFYFFVRGRVGIDDISKVDDVARSYLLLRPIDKDAKLCEGPIGDSRTARLLALPKKVLPASGKDRFMVFVEMSSPSFAELKTEFLAASDYETRTAGTRHTPAATPVGEGVYAITTTGRESHLAYKTTLPEKPGPVQSNLGLREQGSFILSTKNPQYSGPSYAQLPQGPKFSEEIIEEFRSLRWLPTKPAHLDYANAQMLLIGDSAGLDKAVEMQDEDKEKGKEEPREVLEHLEDEDLERMRHMARGESESLFADLHAQAKDYPKLQTTF